MDGWIKMHRKLINNCLIKKPNYLTVWVYLLLSANHEESSFIWNNQKVIVRPGQVLTGRKAISKATKVKEGTIENILKYLESEHQIEQQKTSKYRIITITNWRAYQNNEQQIEQQSDNRVTHTRMFKNEKNKDLKEREGLTWIAPPEMDIQGITLSQKEFENLKYKYGETAAKQYIQKLDNYICSKGKRYKSHYKTILVWMARDNIMERKHSQPVKPAIVEEEKKVYTPEEIKEAKNNVTQFLTSLKA